MAWFSHKNPKKFKVEYLVVYVSPHRLWSRPNSVRKVRNRHGTETNHFCLSLKLIISVIKLTHWHILKRRNMAATVQSTPTKLGFSRESDERITALKVEHQMVQKKTFTKWINSHLSKRKVQVADLNVDLKSGVNLLLLLEQLTNENLVSFILILDYFPKNACSIQKVIFIHEVSETRLHVNACRSLPPKVVLVILAFTAWKMSPKLSISSQANKYVSRVLFFFLY